MHHLSDFKYDFVIIYVIETVWSSFKGGDGSYAITNWKFFMRMI
jgi:hypothetical protein